MKKSLASEVDLDGHTNSPPVHIERWPSESPLRVLLVFVSLAIWGLIILSIVGLIYALAIGVFIFFVHLMFVAHVRGSAAIIHDTALCFRSPDYA